MWWGHYLGIDSYTQPGASKGTIAFGCFAAGLIAIVPLSLADFLLWGMTTYFWYLATDPSRPRAQ